MAIIHKSPGPWFSFVKRKDNKNLTISELKSKFNKEQLLFENFITNQIYQDYNKNNSSQINNQLHQAGDKKIKQALIFVGFNPLNADISTVTGNETQIFLNMLSPVNIDTSGGVPFIDVDNDQLGGGSSSTIRYTLYNPGADQLQLRFAYTNPASATNTGPVAANVVPVGIDLVANGITKAPLSSGGVVGEYTNPTYSGDVGDGNMELRVNVVTDGADLNIGSAIVTVAGALFQPTDSFTFDNGQLGLASVGGQLTFNESTIDGGQFQGDTLSMAGTSVNLNGGVVTNSDGSPTNLDYITTSTRGSFPT